MTKRSKFFLLAGFFLVFASLFIFPQIRSFFSEFAIQYGYFGIFVASFLGGISLFIPLPYPIFLIALAAAGLNPWFLGISSAVGATLGDSVSYAIGRAGGAAYAENKTVHRFQVWLEGVYTRYPRVAPIILLIWASLVPLPNELFVIPFGVAGYGIWKTLAITSVGNLVFVMLLANGVHFLFLG